MVKAHIVAKAEYPSDHKAGMAVTEGGSSCSNCEYLKPGLKCGNEYFQRWHGSDKIPTKDATKYCSDWWEPREKKKTLGEQVQHQRENK